MHKLTDPRTRINRPPIHSASDLGAFLLLMGAFLFAGAGFVAFLWVLAAVAGE